IYCTKRCCLDYPRLYIYHNLLLEILQYGIERKFQVVDFGQTAEDSKLKLGCSLHSKYLCLHHSVSMLNLLAKKMTVFFSYQVPAQQYQVFKSEGAL
ncbi:MAG: hypothetical protein NUK65_10370, partial [Firmicutes bacterium]|nr:hypothetical protein [Bacillota bacterium]